MLTGVIPATEKVLARAGLTLSDIDLFEVNEAFAPVVLAWAQDTGADLAQDQRQRRRDRHRPPARRQRRPHHDDPGQRPGAARRPLRPADDVRGRRHGQRHHHRTAVVRGISARSRTGQCGDRIKPRRNHPPPRHTWGRSGVSMPEQSRMGAALFTSGPYIEMVISPVTPMTPTVEDGVVTWRVPLGEGAVPHVSLEDCGYYVRWLFDHPGAREWHGSRSRYRSYCLRGSCCGV